MSDRPLYDVKWPSRKSKLNSLARFLVANSERCGGQIPISAIFERHPEFTRHWLSASLPYLRRRYSYYCRIHGSVVQCATEWPQGHLSREFTATGFTIGVSKPAKTDPRLEHPTIKRKYAEVTTRDSPIWKIKTYILRHRKPGTHVLDCEWLFTNFPGGAKAVQRKFRVLNERYGFKIRKVNPGKPDRMWIIDKLPNVRIENET